MDYQDVPKELLDLAVKVSKAANAEYWAVDVAVGKDGKYRILECATAFAAFPYIRDWIGQYIMWLLSDGRFPLPNIPLYNWEELGKMDSSVLRTLRYITFGRYTPSYDGAYFLDQKTKETEEGEMYLHEMDSLYPMLKVLERKGEEWPSEIWNYQDNYGRSVQNVLPESNPEITEDEGDESETNPKPALELSEKKLRKMLEKIDGIGRKKSEKILEQLGSASLINILEDAPEKLQDEFKWFKKKMVKQMTEIWGDFKQTLS